MAEDEHTFSTPRGEMKITHVGIGDHIIPIGEQPMKASEIIAQFNDNVSRFVSGVVFSQGSVVGILKKACRSDSDYRLVLKALSGKTSSKELTDAQWFALYKFIQPVKPEGQKWQSGQGDDELAIQCNMLVNSAVDQPGQGKMPF